MRELPIHLQGFLHIIGIPLDEETEPSAYISYIRPNHYLIHANQSISSETTRQHCDIVDDTILATIKQRHPNAFSILKNATYEEQLKNDVDGFSSWHNDLIHIIPSIHLNISYLNNQDAQQAKAMAIPLTLYTGISPETIQREAEKNRHDNIKFYFWMNLFGRYSSLFNSYKVWDCQDEYNYYSLIKHLEDCPVLDLKSILKELYSIG